MSSAIAMPLPREGWPLSPEQRWVLAAPEHNDADTGSREAAIVRIDIRGALDVTRLRRALGDVASVHESLCMAFRPVPGYRGLRQQPLHPVPVPEWDIVDLRGQADVAQHLTRRLAAEQHTPFKLDDGGVWRAVLFRPDEQQWQLMLSVSHLVADQGSLVTLSKALLERYMGADQAGQPPPPLHTDDVFQYTQFVAWRQELAQGDEVEAGRAYWDRHLARADTDGPQAPRLAYRAQPRSSQTAPAFMSRETPGRRCSLVQPLDTAMSAGLDSIRQVSGVPVEVLVQAAWWVLLARISGQQALLGGWQHDCRRDYAALAGAVGIFEKILPLALACARDDTFETVVHRLHAILEAHRNWQEYWPVEEPPQLAHCEVGFMLAEAPVLRAPQPDAVGLVWEVCELPGPSPVFALALQVELDEADKPWRISLHYAALQYSRAAMHCLLSQYMTLLAALPDHMGTTLANLPVLGAHERDRLLALHGVVLDPGTRTLPEHIAEWGKRQPDALALVGRDLTLSYAVLNARINRLAHWLIVQGVQAETPVAVLLPRSVDLVVALLAVLRAGGAYLPLDPTWPSARRQAILADAKPLLVLSHSALSAADDVESACIRHVMLDTFYDGLAPDESQPAVNIALHQAAYILYTSGSTGTPKGVVIEHGQLLHYVAAVRQALNFSGCSRFALTSTVAADLGNTMLFSALFHGACLVVADQEDMQSAAAFAHFLKHYAIDCIKIVPSHLEALLDPASVTLPRLLVLGGEATPLALADKLSCLAPHCRIFNHYGPTETTVGVMTHVFDPHDVSRMRRHSKMLPLTQPLANCRVYLLDETLALVPTGALGELYVGGPQVCRGYIHQDAANSFVADPFQPGARLYRTGDLGRYLPEGGLQLAGRVDQQLKIRGWRIEPAEVEAALLAVPGIRQAAVRGWGEGERAQLVAYLVTASETVPTSTDVLQAALRQHLPAAMVPTSFVRLLEFPRLENGKIDRQSLPSPMALPSQEVRVEPRDAVEAVLAHIAAALLERDAISVTDNFFDLGGHSLLVIRLVSQVRKLLQIELPPGVVFDHPRIADLAQVARRYEDEPGGLEHMAQLRWQLLTMSADQRSALQERARIEAQAESPRVSS